MRRQAYWKKYGKEIYLKTGMRPLLLGIWELTLIYKNLCIVAPLSEVGLVALENIHRRDCLGIKTNWQQCWLLIAGNPRTSRTKNALSDGRRPTYCCNP